MGKKIKNEKKYIIKKKKGGKEKKKCKRKYRVLFVLRHNWRYFSHIYVTTHRCAGGLDKELSGSFTFIPWNTSSTKKKRKKKRKKCKRKYRVLFVLRHNWRYFSHIYVTTHRCAGGLGKESLGSFTFIPWNTSSAVTTNTNNVFYLANIRWYR